MVNDSVENWFGGFLAKWEAVAGTVHTHHDDLLTLCCSVNIPPQVLAHVGEIPKGKGMAGLALANRAPVQTCNLKEDDSGAVKPGARAVDAKAAVAFPVFDDRGEVRAVIGMAWRDPRDLNENIVALLSASGNNLPEVAAG